MEKTKKTTAGASLKKNLASGTKNTDKKDLSATDICRIISECKQAGVQSLDVNGLSLSFLPRRNEEVVTASQPTDLGELPTVSELSPQDTKNFELMDQSLMEEAEEAQMMIDDPYAFEQLQIQRDRERSRQINGKA